MNRRDFLRIGGAVATALLLQFNPLGKLAMRPVEVKANGMTYRGTLDGKILISADEGRTWQLHTNFGEDFSILSLFTNLSGQIHAQLEFAGHPFELALVYNSKTWKTI